MKTPQIKATTPRGDFTRTTDRTYTHIVLVCGKPEGFYEDQEKNDRSHTIKEIARYQAVVDSGVLPAGYSCSLDDYKKWLLDLKVKLENMAAVYAARIEKNHAEIEAGQFICQTWCGRPDLAQKAAATLRKHHHTVEIHPVDTTVAGGTL